MGAPGGAAWRQRALRLAFCKFCLFRPLVVKALDASGIEWEMAVETESDRTIEAAVSADLAVHAMIEGTQPPYLEQVDHNGALPMLPSQMINLYGAQGSRGEVHTTLANLLRNAFHTPAARLRAV